MSNKNYHKMYDKPKAEVAEEITQEVETVAEAPAEAAVEPAVEVQMAIKEVAEPVVLEEEKPETVSAIVVGCAKLNVREEPSPKGAVIAIIDASNEVVVYDSESFGNYYKICTAAGVEGYCVKDYLELK